MFVDGLHLGFGTLRRGVLESAGDLAVAYSRMFRAS